jgi:hypothetical protein
MLITNISKTKNVKIVSKKNVKIIKKFQKAPYANMYLFYVKS